MFFLRVNSVDSDHPLTPQITFSAAQSNRESSHTPKFSERRGLLHLFRSISHSSLPNPASRSSLVFIVAVPNDLSYEDLIRFCGCHIDHVSELIFIRNDEIENWYSVLIRLVDQFTADGFYSSFNGKRFSPGEAEVCHILFLLSVEYTEFAEVASTPPAGCIEIPTCPVCLERLNPDTSGILSTLCDHSFQCPCVSKWTYLSCQVCRFSQQQDEKLNCFVCGRSDNIWVCTICGFVGCGRYKGRHAIQHWKDTQHCYSLNLRTQHIWDYVGNNCVHRLNQNQSKSSSHMILDKYNHLLVTQLETQRKYYESLLVEAKSKVESSISEAVEKAVASRMHDIQNELEKCTLEKNAVAEVNKNLIKSQAIWRNKVIEVAESGGLFQDSQGDLTALPQTELSPSVESPPKRLLQDIPHGHVILPQIASEPLLDNNTARAIDLIEEVSPSLDEKRKGLLRKILVKYPDLITMSLRRKRLAFMFESLADLLVLVSSHSMATLDDTSREVVEAILADLEQINCDTRFTSHMRTLLSKKHVSYQVLRGLVEETDELELKLKELEAVAEQARARLHTANILIEQQKAPIFPLD